MSRFYSFWKTVFPTKQSGPRREKTIQRTPIPASIEILEERLMLFVTTGSIWPGGSESGTTITYSYSNLLDGNLGGNLTPAQLRSAVEEALTLWSTYAPLHFVEQPDSGPAPDADYTPAGHPIIRLGHVYIDGISGNDTLAETDSPGPSGLNGDVRFDDGNTWFLNPSNGVDFLEVAVHEIGHALGLDHPPESTTAVMGPHYAERYAGLGTAFLYQDDIDGIRYLYGSGAGSVTPYTGGPTDDHGGSSSTATGVGIDSTTIGNIETGGDSDWFRFGAIAGTQYTFETHLGTLNDSTIRLVGQDGQNLLAFDDDGGVGKASKITWTATATGTFFLEVKAYLSSQTGTYTLTVTHNDDFGGCAAGATSLTANSPRSGVIGVAGDRDWFSINVTAGQTYRVLLDDQGLPHGNLTLYASDGYTPLLSGDGLGAGTNPWLIWKANTTETVYVSAGGYTNETGSYSISYTTVDGMVVSTPGSGMVTQVRVANASNGVVLYTYRPYGNFTGGAFVAMGDVNGDGIADVITGADAGGGPHVRVISGANGAQLLSFFAYGTSFSGGVRVASADVNGDGKDDVITGAGAGGGPHVRVFSGNTGTELFSFFPYSNFSGGVFVAAGDVNGDGKADIITGPGATGGPNVKVISGADGSSVLHNFMAYSPSFTGGIYVAAGDVNGDGKADIVTGPGAGGGPHVRAFSGVTGTELTAIFPYSMNFTGGVRVGASDVNHDGHADIITAPGPGGGPDVRVFSGANNTQMIQMFPYVGSFTGGVYVDGSPAILPGGPSALIATVGTIPGHETIASSLLSTYSLGLEPSNPVQAEDRSADWEHLTIEAPEIRLVLPSTDDELSLWTTPEGAVEFEEAVEAVSLPETPLINPFDEELFRQLLM